MKTLDEIRDQMATEWTSERSQCFESFAFKCGWNACMEHQAQAQAALELVKSIAKLDHRIVWQNEAREVLKIK